VIATRIRPSDLSIPHSNPSAFFLSFAFRISLFSFPAFAVTLSGAAGLSMQKEEDLRDLTKEFAFFGHS